MSLIVTEHKIRDIINQFNPVIINGISKQPYFSWGKKEELNRFIIGYNNQDEQPYPLIWLLPSPDKHNILSGYCEKDVSLVIATLETRKDLYNAERYTISYDNVLNPLCNTIIEAFQSASTTRIIDPSSISIYKEPNYTDQEQSATIDLWDAIRIDLKIEFNNNCLNAIKWMN